MRDPQKGLVYIVAESRMEAIPGAVPKQKKGKKASEPAQKGFEVCPLHLLCYLLPVALILTSNAKTLPALESAPECLVHGCRSQTAVEANLVSLSKVPSWAMALNINVRAETLHVITKPPVCNLGEFG